jgi:hypothetical protein
MTKYRTCCYLPGRDPPGCEPKGNTYEKIESVGVRQRDTV